MPLNAAALEPLYRVIVSTRLLTNIRTTHPHLWNQLSDAIALAESPAGLKQVVAATNEHPAIFRDASGGLCAGKGLTEFTPVQQPPSGMTPRQARNHAFVWPEPPVLPSAVMTMEQAMEMAKCYACLGLDALTSLGPADLAAEFIRIDCAARIKTLEWVRDHVLINDRADDGPMHVAIERRLKEINATRT